MNTEEGEGDAQDALSLEQIAEEEGRPAAAPLFLACVGTVVVRS